MPLTLSPKEDPRLLEVSQTTHAPRQLHRAPALLWLHAGDPVDEVATRWFTTPRPVFRGLRRLPDRQGLERPARRAEGPRRGRPTTLHGLLETLVREGIERDPRHLGSQAPVWTAPFWRQELRARPPMAVSRRRVGRALARLGLAGKRPRSAWARRAPPWRQATGGAHGAWQAASGQ
jgi:hypothetical protein